MNNNYKKHYSNYDLKLGDTIAGSISVFYSYADNGQKKRKIEFIPYPNLFRQHGLNYFMDNHWRLLDEEEVENTDDASELKKINELIFTVIIENFSNTKLLQIERKRTAFDFEIPIKGNPMDFWLVHEFKDFFSIVHQPVKRVYQKGGYFVMGFDIAKNDLDIIDEVKLALQ